MYLTKKKTNNIKQLSNLMASMACGHMTKKLVVFVLWHKLHISYHVIITTSISSSSLLQLELNIKEKNTGITWNLSLNITLFPNRIGSVWDLLGYNELQGGATDDYYYTSKVRFGNIRRKVHIEHNTI